MGSNFLNFKFYFLLCARGRGGGGRVGIGGAPYKKNGGKLLLFIFLLCARGRGGSGGGGGYRGGPL